jgi:ATP-dependent Clp protease protease subunit
MDLYAAFSGGIDASAVDRIFKGVAGASAQKTTNLHILFQSGGGTVGDGVSLYNYFRSLPFGLHLYNSGTVASIGVIAFLGSKNRYASQYASFMVHKTRFPHTVPADAVRLEALAQSARIDDERTRKILDTELKITGQELENYLISETPIKAAKALEIGLVGAIRDFAPPAGVQVYAI